MVIFKLNKTYNIKGDKMLKNYIENLSIDELNNLAKKNDIYLSSEELNFTYKFIKKNIDILLSKNNVDLSKFKNKYSSENYIKIISKIKYIKEKYSKYI